MELTGGLGEPRETSICFLTLVGLVSTPEPSGPLDPPAPGLLWSSRTEPGLPSLLGCRDVSWALGLRHLAWGHEVWKGQEESRALCLQPCSCQAVPLRLDPTSSGHLVLV